VVPIETPALRQELRQIIDIQLADRRCAWDMRADGSYVQRRPRDGEDSRSSQELQIELAQRRLDEATRLGRKIKRSGFRSGSQVRGR
jgi:polyphosphate kinase